MITRPLLFTCSALLFSLPAFSQDDTAAQRAVYEATNKKIDSCKVVKATHQDEELTWQLTGWSDEKGLRKILATVPGEDGDGFEEYYLDNGGLVFAFRQYNAAAEKVQDRFYFKDGRMVKWLGNDKKPVDPKSADFTSEATRLTGNCTSFIKVLNAKSGGKTKPADDKAAAAKIVTGTFTGIEEGDYFHWNMTTDAGEEVSYFILKPDASVDKVLAKPESFKGRKCKVQWKETTENIPEAGGKMKVQQILSVEWTGKK